MLNLICFIFTLYLHKKISYQLSIFSSRNLLELQWLKFVCLSALAGHGNINSEKEFWRLPKIPIMNRMIPDPRAAQTRPGSAVLLGQWFNPLPGFTVPVLCCPPCEQLLWTSQEQLVVLHFLIFHCPEEFCSIIFLSPLSSSFGFPIVRLSQSTFSNLCSWFCLPQTPASLVTFLLSDFFLNCEA